MRKLAIVALVAALCGCAGFQKALTILQDPATATLLRDLQAILTLIEQTADTPAETPEAQAAMQRTLDGQLDAATELIQQLRDRGETGAANKFGRRVEQYRHGPS